MRIGTPPHRPVRRPRPLTEQQLGKRMEATLDEITALGGAWQMPVGEIRWRLLLLERQVRGTLDRWPRDS